MFPPIRLKEALTLGGLSPRQLLSRTWARIGENEIMTRAAAVSFYAMLALVPFMAIVLTVSVKLLPDITRETPETGIGNMTADQLDHMLEKAFPKESYEVVHDQIIHLQKPDNTPTKLLIFGLFVTIWLASSVFVAIIDAMNRIYGVIETRSIVKIRLVAVIMTCIQSSIFLGSLLAIVILPHVVEFFGLSSSGAIMAILVQWTVITIMVTLSFALSLYVGPDADQRWEWITPGSFVGTAVFLVATLGFRLYVSHFADYDKTYGSLGGVMVLLFWFWISSLVLLTTAQINKIIEESSPLGKNVGQKVDVIEALDLKSIPPEPSQAS